MKSTQHNVTSITDMQAEALRLIDLQQEILQRIKSSRDLVSDESVSKESTSKNPSGFFTAAAIQSKLNILAENHTKLQNLDMVLAVVGTMKAGKSTTINAIVGREILPNRNRPMTALPTRIRHTRGCTSPVLRFEKHGPIQSLIAELRAKADTLTPASLKKLQDSDEHLADALTTLRKKQTLGAAHEGEVEIFHFLAYLNDLVRLSTALGVQFPFHEYTSIEDFPLIEVEFFHLAKLDQAGIGRFTILDTPGFNEEGQQSKLLPMMREQLEKSTAVLAVLDYTQLKSESEGDLRQQLNEIAAYAQGRMFSLVNKFDAKDRNSSNEDQTRKYVAKNLLADAKINPENIFPVSSRNAYLAKQAELTLRPQKEGLAWAEGQAKSWVEDFAELAFGRRWQKNVNDNAAVSDAAQDIWRESLFDAPLTKVIQFGYISAAHQAIDAAAHALKVHADELTGLIDGRLQMLSRTAPELQKAINEVNEQINALSGLQNKAKKDLQKCINTVSGNVDKGIHTANAQVNAAVAEFLEKGSVQIAAVLRGELAAELKRHTFYKKSTAEKKECLLDELLARLPPNLRRSQEILQQLRSSQYVTLDEIKLFFSSPETANEGQGSSQSDTKIFDPEMVYDSRDAAQKALSGINQQVQAILKDAQTTIEQQLETAQADLATSMQSMREEVVEQVLQFDAHAKNLGLDALSFSVPNLPKFESSANHLAVRSDLIDDKSRKVRRQREQSSFWGKFKRTVDVFGADWGYDEYGATENRFTIKTKDLEDHWAKVVKGQLETLTNTVEEEFSRPIQKSSDQFFRTMVDRFNEISENLQGGLNNHKKDLAQQADIRQFLQTLKKLHHPSLQDLSALVNAADYSLAQVQLDITEGKSKW